MTSMSPLFRKCGLAASQDVLLYKSLYVNPLSCSDSPSPLQDEEEDEDEDDDQNHTSTTTTTALLNSSSTLLLLLPRTSISSSISSSNSDFSTSKISSAPSLRPLASVAAIPSIRTHSTVHISNALVQETYKDREDHRTNWTYISSQTEEEDISGPATSCNYSHAAPALKNSNREPPAPTTIFPLIRVSAPKCVDKAHTGCRSDVEESGAEIDFKEEEEEGRDDREGSQLQLIRKHGTVTSCTSNQDIYERNMKKDYHHHHHHHHCKSSMINSGASAGGAGIPEYVMWADPESYTSDHAVAPVSAWSTLANRTLLCRPLPVDVGRCVCYITRERKDGINGYALYTDEGHGRRDRKLAVAHHRRRTGRSEFLVFPADKDSRVAMLGRIQANVVGSRYAIWDEVDLNCTQKGGGTSARSRPLLGVVMFQPTVTTLAGTYRVMQVSIPKYQSMQILPSAIHQQQQQQREISRNNGLPPDSWDSKSRSKNLSKNNVHRLYSRKPSYNKAARRYELDFRDRAKRSVSIKTSTKNFQLTMNEDGKQAILMLAKIGKSNYLLEYRFPLTAYQAFSICLASMDIKLCCSL